MHIPTFSSYGNYASSNYGAHTLVFTDARGAEFYFSYKTLVAFRASYSAPLVVRHNDWGPTTGKHLNAIDGGNKKTRVDAANFGRLLRETFPNNPEFDAA